MFCSKCGKEINQTESFCPNCGTKTRDIEPSYSSPQGSYDVTKKGDAPSMGFAILSFFIPVAGIVLYCVWRDTMPLRAKSCLRGFTSGIIFSIVVYCCIAASAANRHNNIYYNCIISLFKI